MDIKNRINSYKGNLKAAQQTDIVIDSNLKTLESKLGKLKLSKDELTQQMPKTKQSELQSHPVVIGLNESMSKLTEFRAQREDIVKRLTTCL